MPKATKKKKEKAADFSKARLKLGKGKAPAANAVDVSYKARSIVLPTQAIALQKDGSEPRTKRNLGLNDLISHLKHYNANVRNDAILGLRELLDANWHLVDTHLATLVNAVVRHIGDEEASVRKQLLAFSNWLFPRISSEDLLPHSATLLLFTTSAQTHIFPEIRIDAIKFIDVFLKCIPDIVTLGWDDIGGERHGHRVLGGYLGILNAGAKYVEADGQLRATSSLGTTLSPASKLVVLRSLATFLEHAVSDNGRARALAQELLHQRPLDAWFMRDAFPSQEAHERFEVLFNSQRDIAQPRVSWGAEDDSLGHRGMEDYPLLRRGESDPWTLQDLGSILESSASPSEKGSSAFVAHLANTLQSTLVDTYLDHAPSVFAPGGNPSETEINLVLTVSKIALTLYDVIFHLGGGLEVDGIHSQHLEQLIQYMYPHFPASAKDHKLERHLEELNQIFCELSALLSNSTPPSGIRSSRKRKKVRGGVAVASGGAAKVTEKVTAYVLARLRGEPLSSYRGGQPLSASDYVAILPTVWTLIKSPSESTMTPNLLLEALLDHALGISSKSGCKRLSVEFMGRVVLLPFEAGYKGELGIDQGSDLAKKMEEWVVHLPQVLWELGSTQIETSETILRVLLRLLQRRASFVDRAKMMESLESRLMPYFHIKHPTRGAVNGPYTKLPVGHRVRFLALDVIGTLSPGKNLAEVVSLALSDGAEKEYWSELYRIVL